MNRASYSRNPRLEAEIRTVLAELLQYEVKDPRLDAGLLRPSDRPVLRLWVTSGTPPRYLIGNRLLTLDANYEWKGVDPGGRTIQRESTPSRQRYRLAPGAATWSLAVHSLRRDDLVFVPPGTQTLDLTGASLGVDAAGVLQAQFAGRSDRRWRQRTF